MKTARNSRSLVYPVLFAVLLIVIAFSVVRPTAAQQTPPTAANSTAAAGSVARGKYLVEEVAVCGNCHTPRDQNGELDRMKRLAGTPLFFRPAHQVADWPLLAPRIGGTPPGTDEEMITLLTTGVWKTGKPLRQPMPRFHFTREDAQAIIAYLKTVNTGQ